MRKNILIILLFLFSTGLFASNPVLRVYQDRIYESFITNNISIWEGTLGVMEASYKNNPDDELLYDIVLANYGLIGYYLGFDNSSRGRLFLDKAKPYLDELFKLDKYQAQAYAFQSAFYGYEISLNKFRGPTFGPRSNRAADRAVEIDSTYVRVWVEKGNLSFFTPSFLGGSKADAVTFYSKAIDLYEKDMPHNHKWLYLNTLISLAKSYEYVNDFDAAIKVMDKVLEFEPAFKWAKEDYLPSLKSKQE